MLMSAYTHLNRKRPCLLWWTYEIEMFYGNLDSTNFNGHDGKMD